MREVMINSYATSQLHGDVTDGGSQKVVMHATIRPEKYLHVQVEVLDGAYVAANIEAVRTAVADFLAGACHTASEAGLPVSPGGE